MLLALSTLSTPFSVVDQGKVGWVGFVLAGVGNIEELELGATVDVDSTGEIEVVGNEELLCALEEVDVEE
ncbi:unnamed protein product [Haemonchus placei]|uniref:Uncharacterized protein n=1 Tax=Haemonchus placei TaxID=6290 RepID=A0A0N4WLH8_HAEPC|nr:unnamed protein product [Haemonchus placei]